MGRRKCMLLIVAAVALSAPAAGAVPPHRLTGAIEVGPSPAPAGSRMTVQVTVRDPDQSQHIVHIDFGDSTSHEVRFVGECGKAGQGTALDAVFKVPHKYRTAGVYAVVARVFTGGCDDVGDPPLGPGSEALVLTAPAVVTAAATPSNGGEQPTSYVLSSFRARVGKPVQMQFEGQDPDGFVRSIQVKDPSGRVRLFTRADPCIDPVVTWPRDAWATEPFEYKFAEPGRYGFRVRTVTTGCDGRSEQVHETVHRTVVTR